MATATNSLNINGNGVVAFNNTTGAFSNIAMTQYSVLTGGSTAQSINQVAPSATSGVPFISQGSSSQGTFGTAVVAGGGTGVATLTAYELIAAGTTSTGSVQQIGIGTSGQVLYSNGAGALPSFKSAPAGVAWVDVTASTQTIAASTGYVTDNATQVTYTLPATPVFGDVFEITGGVSGAATAPWVIAQNSGQSMHLGNSTTTTGTGGSIASTLQYDSIKCICVVAGASAVWNVISSVGNFIVT